MEFPEEPRPARDPRIPNDPGPGPVDGAPRSRADLEAEAWLRRELAFLYGVERAIKRRARLRKEGWRAIAVAVILAMFAACWYVAAVSSHSLSATSKACATKSATSVSAAAHTTTSSAAGSGESCAS